MTDTSTWATIKWSHSGLKDFETCSRRYHEVKVLKKYPRQETEQTIYGTQLHEQAELHVRDKRPLDPGFAFLQPVLDALGRIPGRPYTEYEMALTLDLNVCGFHDPRYWVRGIADLIIVDDDNLTAHCFDYKGLPLDTEIPVPGGYKLMRDLGVGDVVFGRDGQPCNVMFKSQVHNKPCLELVFDDGGKITCDEDHKWALADGRVAEARTLVVGDHVPLCAPVQQWVTPLLIDPYVLGVWLADGKHTSGEITKPDAFIWEEIERRGYALGKPSRGDRCRAQTVLGLLPSLKQLGVHGNKHIPDAYMHAGAAQRLDLLRGIMDGDGYANPLRQQAVLNTTDAAFATQVAELVASLGERPYVAKTTAVGFGKETPAYPVSWRPVAAIPFLLPRKAEVFEGLATGRSTKRRIRSISRVPTVPTQCIGVDSSDNTYLCTRRYLVTHNSGSNKYPDTDQLTLMSLMIFKHFPHVRQVKSGLLFVLKNTVTRHRVMRDQEEKLWWRYRERVGRIGVADATGVWNPTKSGLCRFCQVHTCEFNPNH
jgi:hypothetical protein